MKTTIRKYRFAYYSLFCGCMLLAAASLKAEENQSAAASADQEVPAWKARWELARTLSYSKKLDESIEQYRKLLAEKPDLAQAKAEMATVMFWKGKQKEALKLIENIPSGKLNPESRLAAADIYAAQGKYDTATTLYLEYLAAKPDDLKVRLKLAEVLSWAKQYEASLKEYEKILSALPDDIQVRRKYALVLSWSGKYEQAAEELKKTLK